MEIPIDLISEDHAAWPRKELDVERVWLFEGILRDEPDLLPPIEVVRDGTTWVLADGWHRLAARRRLGQDVVPVLVLEVPPGEDPRFCAFRVGVESSAESAKPLTTQEKHAAVKRWIQAHPEMSDREIARRIGVSNSTVSGIRRGKIEANTPQASRTPPEFRAIVKHMRRPKARGETLGRLAAALDLGTGEWLRGVSSRRLAEEFVETLVRLNSGGRDEADVLEKIGSALEEFASVAVARLRGGVRIARAASTVGEVGDVGDVGDVDS